MMLWKISGHACQESGSGDMTLYVVGENDFDVPDPKAAIEQATAGKYEWACVNEIIRVVQLPDAWEADYAPDFIADAIARSKP